MFSIDVIKKSNILIKINFIYIQISTATSILLHLKSVTINPPPRISASLERGEHTKAQEKLQTLESGPLQTAKMISLKWSTFG